MTNVPSAQYVNELDYNPRLERYNRCMPKIDHYLKLKRVPRHRNEDQSHEISRDAVKKRLGKVLMEDPDFAVVNEDSVLEEVRL